MGVGNSRPQKGRLNIQEALDAPTVYTAHFPSSFYPRSAFTGSLLVEGRIPQKTIATLGRRGHDVHVLSDWENGKVMGVRYDKARGAILGGVSPRRQIAYALGW